MKKFLIAALTILLLLLLSSCAASDPVCYYGYFESQAFVFIYNQANNTVFGIRLPLEQILLWGKASQLDSLPIAMRNFVGLKEQGFFLGTSENLEKLCDILDALGSEQEGAPSNEKRLGTLVSQAELLSKKPLLDNINLLCGQDCTGLLKLFIQNNPDVCCYDAHDFFNSDDLNFSQRYFSQWLGQVLGGNI